MNRIQAADTVAVLPAHSGSGAFEFFSNGPPGTVLDADWANGIQEELAYLIETVGSDVLDEADLTQLGQVLGHIRGIRSHATDTGGTSTPHTRVLIASTNSQASGDDSAVVGGVSSGATGAPSAVAGASGAEASGANSFAAAVSSGKATGDGAACLAANGSGSPDPEAEGDYSFVAGVARSRARHNYCAAIASQDADAGDPSTGGTGSFVLGADGSAVHTGGQGGAVADTDSTVTGQRSLAAAGHDHTIAGADSAAVAAQYCEIDAGVDNGFVAGSWNAEPEADQTALLACAILTGYKPKARMARSFVAAAEGWVEAGDGATGYRSAAIAAYGTPGTPARAGTKGDQSAVLGVTDSEADADHSVVLGAVETKTNDPIATAQGCDTSQNSGTRSVYLGGRYAELGSDDAVAGGYHATTAPTWNGTDQNLSFKFDLVNGTLALDNTTLVSPADYAEAFENLELGELPAGALVALEGRKVRLARKGDPLSAIVGPVSADPMILGNSAALSWYGKHERDALGRRVLEEAVEIRIPGVTVDGVRWDARDARDGFDGTLEEALELVAEDGLPRDAEPYFRQHRIPWIQWRAQRGREAFDGPLVAAPRPFPSDAERYQGPAAKLPRNATRAARALAATRRQRIRWPELAPVEAFRGPESKVPAGVEIPSFAIRWDERRVESRIRWAELAPVEAFEGPVSEASRPFPKGATRFNVESRRPFVGPPAGSPFEELAELEGDELEAAVAELGGKIVRRQVPKTAADFDPARPYVPRAERPEEWTAVAIVGQVRIRVDATVEVGDLVDVGDEPGIATRSSRLAELEAWAAAAELPGSAAETLVASARAAHPIRVLELVEPFDADAGFAVALAGVRM